MPDLSRADLPIPDAQASAFADQPTRARGSGGLIGVRLGASLATLLCSCLLAGAPADASAAAGRPARGALLVFVSSSPHSRSAAGAGRASSDATFEAQLARIEGLSVGIISAITMTAGPLPATYTLRVSAAIETARRSKSVGPGATSTTTPLPRPR